MENPNAEAFSHSAVAMISFLLEDNAPIAARWLPDNDGEALDVLLRLRDAGMQIAALAHSAIALRTAPESRDDV